MELSEFSLSASLFHKAEIKFLRSLSCSVTGNRRNCCMNAGYTVNSFQGKFVFFVLLLCCIDLLRNANCRHVLPSGVLLTTVIFNGYKFYERGRTVSRQ